VWARRVYVGFEVLLQNQNERRALGDASEGVEESRREERWRGSPVAANSAGDARSGCGDPTSNSVTSMRLV
jgi:hypothetical protein